MSITAHALIESVVNYGLAVYVSHRSQIQSERTDSSILNKAARKIIATGLPVRREVFRTFADTRTVANHHLLKIADMVGRVLGAERKTAQTNLIHFVNATNLFPKYEIIEGQRGLWGERYRMEAEGEYVEEKKNQR